MCASQSYYKKQNRKNTVAEYAMNQSNCPVDKLNEDIEIEHVNRISREKNKIKLESN